MPETNNEMFQQLGVITRQLHDALNELGYTSKLQGAAEELPDARSRLEYIARLTGEAAEKVLNQVDEAKKEQERIVGDSRALMDTLSRVPGLKAAMPELTDWANDIEKAASSTDARLTEIMMAQDFHDLTGQVIKRVVSLAGMIEEQLLQLLLQAAPNALSAEQKGKSDKPAPALSGPVVNAEGRTDVVTDQAQVDDLLASLGF